jgi:hypothetical protein
MVAAGNQHSYRRPHPLLPLFNTFSRITTYNAITLSSGKPPDPNATVLC